MQIANEAITITLTWGILISAIGSLLTLIFALVPILAKYWLKSAMEKDIGSLVSYICMNNNAKAFLITNIAKGIVFEATLDIVKIVKQNDMTLKGYEEHGFKPPTPGG